MSGRLKAIIFEILKSLSSQKQYQSLLRKSGMKIGHDCELYKNVTWGSEPYLISLGDHVRIASGCKLITHDGGVWVLRRLKNIPNIDLVKRIQIGNNVHIGMNAIIMPGVTIGDNCIIGCGAIVTKNISANSIAVGVPARVIKNINDYYEQHKDEFIYTKNMDEKSKKQFLVSELIENKRK